MQRLDKFLNHLSENGYRVTRQRRLVAEALFKAEGHLSADELCDLARRSNPDVSRASVYRTLELMSRGGFATGNAFGADRMLYETACGRRHHDHLVCDHCGEVEEFHSERIEAAQLEIASRHGFKPNWHSLRIHGLCRKCAAEAPPQKKSKRPKKQS